MSREPRGRRRVLGQLGAGALALGAAHPAVALRAADASTSPATAPSSASASAPQAAGRSRLGSGAQRIRRAHLGS
jgi:hypothetical protein